MKLIGFVLFASLAVKAQVESESFNHHMRDNIHQVIRDNPEKFETRNPGRFPASIQKVELKENDSEKAKEEKRLKMESLQQQGYGLPKW